MPTSPWKKAMAADVFFSGLRSRSSSSLVVQTGFPTSLVDLIVKNHDRLKKSSRDTKKKSSLSLEVPRLQVPECPSADPVIENPRSADRRTDARPGFQFMVITLILLAVLVIWKKKLVAGITISAFALLMLEICGLRGWSFVKRCAEARKRLDSVIEIIDMGAGERASPICEIGAQLRADLSVSVVKCEESRIKDHSNELLSESRDIGKVSRKQKLESSGDSKAKKLRRKFMLRKFCAVGEVVRVPHCVEATEEEFCGRDLVAKDELKRVSGDEIWSFKTCHGDLGDGEDAYSTHINVDENKSFRIYEFVFIIIILCGLVRGKDVALLLSVVWFFLCKFIIIVRSKRKLR
ncbi:uncharacterized protein LOC110030459 [Phalaenopsis equestris]|uniref:uncharacterized protein LOC110030459 n=1 Tax=Phalaenopsis equestris TaxID=78828 RepID=UPI0009E5E497|nr:uncharacterized protein LOC110030459 [Phalaenopsis equestris]